MFGLQCNSLTCCQQIRTNNAVCGKWLFRVYGQTEEYEQSTESGYEYKLLLNEIKLTFIGLNGHCIRLLLYENARYFRALVVFWLQSFLQRRQEHRYDGPHIDTQRHCRDERVSVWFPRVSLRS